MEAIPGGLRLPKGTKERERVEAILDRLRAVEALFHKIEERLVKLEGQAQETPPPEFPEIPSAPRRGRKPRGE